MRRSSHNRGPLKNEPRWEREETGQEKGFYEISKHGYDNKIHRNIVAGEQV